MQHVKRIFLIIRKLVQEHVRKELQVHQEREDNQRKPHDKHEVVAEDRNRLADLFAKINWKLVQPTR